MTAHTLLKPTRAWNRVGRLAALSALSAAAITLAGCQAFAPPAPVAAPVPAPVPAPAPAPEPPPPPPPPVAAPTPAPPPAPPVGVVELSSRAGEQALLAGLRAYEDGQYDSAEQKLRASLKAGLASPKDRAAAHKTLAFIYCTSNRVPACEAAFKAARAADKGFKLDKAEAGHPVWGPVYRRALGIR